MGDDLNEKNRITMNFLKRLQMHLMIKLDTTTRKFCRMWYIDEKICDDLIQLFKDNKEHQKVGVSGGLMFKKCKRLY